MPASPVEAEATGQEFIEATFSGTTFQVPLDVDSWPLDTIRCCRELTKSDGLAVNSAHLITALKELLGPTQWPAFIAATSKRGQLAPASDALAAAVGIPAGRDTDIVFGAIPRLLALIDTWPGKVESDLDRFWGIDYRDRWLITARGPRRGRRRLTLRQIHARLAEGLPSDSALAIAMNGGKVHRTGAELVLMDVYEVIAHHRHPSRPMPVEDTKARDAQKAAEAKAKADYAARQEKRQTRQLETARANARISQRGNARAQTQSST